MKTSIATILIAATILLLQGFSLAAQSEQAINTIFEEANMAFSEGDYKTAIEKYQEITSQSGQSAAVLYNLGNSYAQSGQIGMAVLHYERAVRIAPSDSNIVGNLQLLKKESGLFVNEYEGFERILFSLSLSQWLILFLVVLAVLACFHIFSLLHPIRKKTIIVFTAFCCLILCLSSIGGYSRYQKFNPAIVISSDARLLISPFETSTSVGIIQEGRSVYPSKTHKNYTHVVDETNRKGWIANSAIEAVCNPAGK